MRRPDQMTISEESPSGETQGSSSQPPEPSRLEQPSLFEESDLGPEIEPEKTSADLLNRMFAFEREPSLIYLGSLLVGSALLVVTAALGMFPWVASAVGVVGLLATMFRGGRWVALACGTMVVIIVGASFWPREPTLADVGATSTGATGAQVTSADEAPEGSLGIRLSELSDLWNELDQPPMIRRGFSRSPERGQLDGFVLRFDEGASLAGAYDPADDYVYALWASTRLDHPAASTMYLHLCFVLHPYSQGCIDAYWNEGLDGSSLEDYRASRHSAEWEIDDETWRLAIAGNVQEIRVLGSRP